MAVGDKRDRYGVTFGCGAWIRDFYALTTLYMSGAVPLEDFESIDINWFVGNVWC
jgi:hypothetical protein